MKREPINRNHFLSFIGLGFFILLAFASADDKASDNEKQEKNSSSTTSNQTKESSSNVIAKPNEVTFQDYFIQQKGRFYNEGYVNAGNDAAKALFAIKSEKLTNHLLDSTNQTLKNWTGVISMITLDFGHTKHDIELMNSNTTMSAQDIIAKYPEGRDINLSIKVGTIGFNSATYMIEACQEHVPENNTSGIKPNSPLYETILGLKKGQKVIFNAKVLKAKDFTSTNDKINEQLTYLSIELIDIKPIDFSSLDDRQY